MKPHGNVRALAQSAKLASAKLSLCSTQIKNKALLAMAGALGKHQEDILKANAKDIADSKARGIGPSLLGRLALSESKIKAMAESLRLIASLPDPVGRLISERKRPNGLLVQKISVPLGVILIIYESRPNVTADCMALCLKSGNSVLLKGGREALNSNRAIHRVLSEAAYKSGIPNGVFGLVPSQDRRAVKSLLNMNECIDLVIPRGGEGLIREVARTSRIPVIKHFKGVCHVFVDKAADLVKAEKIIINAKVQNPGVCNAMETLLVHQDAAKSFLPRIAKRLQELKVELRGCEKTTAILPGLKRANAKDWTTEYLDLVLSIRVVKDVGQAIAHIETYGSHHSDAIVTEDQKAASIFTASVDSACVFVNSSTRFNDGGEFGMGAEMGISTDKLHARGPMGLEELTSYKYVVLGQGQVRS